MPTQLEVNTKSRPIKSRRGSDRLINLIQLRKQSTACNFRDGWFWSRK